MGPPIPESSLRIGAALVVMIGSLLAENGFEFGCCISADGATAGRGLLNCPGIIPLGPVVDGGAGQGNDAIAPS